LSSQIPVWTLELFAADSISKKAFFTKTRQTFICAKILHVAFSEHGFESVQARTKFLAVFSSIKTKKPENQASNLGPVPNLRKRSRFASIVKRDGNC
jgi:hypothetical protein